MTYRRCLQCGDRRGTTRAEIAIKCKAGWLHYAPDICKACMDTYESLVESVSPNPAIQRTLPWAVFTLEPDA